MTIECNETINKEYVQKNGIKPYDTIIIQNTAGQSSQNLSEIEPNIYIRVIGGYDPKLNPRYDSERHRRRNTFDADDLANIIREFEIIEKDIKPDWTNLKKSLYIFLKLRQIMHYATEKYEMSYEPEGDFYSIDREIRGIYGILDKQAICAGFAMIYKEFMERQGVPCKYRARHGRHSWNEVDLNNNGEYYPLDLTMDILSRRNGSNLIQNFFNNPKFYEHEMHQANDNNGECVSRTVSSEELKEAFNEIGMETTLLKKESNKTHVDNGHADVDDDVDIV